MIAAGLGSPALAQQVGLDIPLRPQRGQVLVTERLAPFAAAAVERLRQTGDGTVMIGATQEEVGLRHFDHERGGAELSTRPSASCRRSRARRWFAIGPACAS